MKKIVVAVLATLFLGSLLGCQNPQRVIPPVAETMAQDYQGVIPCADCEGITVSLSLQQGGRYRISEGYQGTANLSDVQQGRWSRTAEKLVLISDAGEKRYFRPVPDGLEMMDMQGNPISSANNYRLQRVKSGG
ncbi:copper resistance protein NlpE N-terminal domain-containing protein [Erwinia mallotivora]|uniref:Copper homeostasis protein n=1 Tax=Erwinia mallotivora TaxID=69222 RepID=A0A014NPK4_9GAMM|nr:copper resistance protein NlpE N-terminal domain-containing protein [Erwinia mallotivora]EXU75725.1 copper homeostasis protein [Erwinia mallotivora]